MKVKKFIMDDEKIPFDDWFKKLDGAMKAKVRARLKRLELTNNFGSYKQIGSIFELKLMIRSGLRIYFGREGNDIIILLGGGNKSSQKKDIKKAKEYWEAYNA